MNLRWMMALSIFVTACGAEVIEPLPEDSGAELRPRTAQLVVNGGFGSGRYEIGEKVHVFADIDPATEGVVGWVNGSGAEWHWEVEIPARGLALWPIVRPRTLSLEVLTYRGVTTRAKLARIARPDRPRGVLLLLHGTNGSSKLIEGVEASALAAEAVARGLVVVAPEAEESVAGDLDGNRKRRWDPALEADNVDLRNLESLLAELEASGVVAPNLPRYALGMSNGGVMAVSLGTVSAKAGLRVRFPRLEFRAVTSYCATGSSEYARSTETPTAWRTCENDDVSPEATQESIENAQALARRGVRTDTTIHNASPLYDARFARIPGVSVETSAAIARELRCFGAVDADGYLLIGSEELSVAVSRSPESFPTLSGLEPALQKEVGNQLRVMRAEHEMFSDYNDLSLDFLLDGAR